MSNPDRGPPLSNTFVMGPVLLHVVDKPVKVVVAVYLG